jgi:hypothetical protein
VTQKWYYSSRVSVNQVSLTTTRLHVIAPNTRRLWKFAMQTDLSCWKCWNRQAILIENVDRYRWVRLQAHHTWYGHLYKTKEQHQRRTLKTTWTGNPTYMQKKRCLQRRWLPIRGCSIMRENLDFRGFWFISLTQQPVHAKKHRRTKHEWWRRAIHESSNTDTSMMQYGNIEPIYLQVMIVREEELVK